MQRLLESIKGYLAEMKVEEDKKRQEEEERKNAEKNKKQKNEMLEKLREEKAKLEAHKTEIDNELVQQEQNLIDLRNEKRIVEAKLKEIEDEEAELTGKQKKLPLQMNMQESNKFQSANPLDSKFLRFIDKKQKEMRECAAQRHGFVNVSLVLLNTLSVLGVILFTLCVFVVDRTEEDLPTMCLFWLTVSFVLLQHTNP